MAKKKSTLSKSVVVLGPSVLIDGKEVVNFKTEFAAEFGVQSLNGNSLREKALKIHQSFVDDANVVISEAASVIKKRGKATSTKPESAEQGS